MPDNPDVDRRLAGHADLSVLHAGGERLFLAPYLKGSGFASCLEARCTKLFFPAIRQGSGYPQDAQLNLCLAGRYMFYNSETVPHDIVDNLTSEHDITRLPVKQGYSRCAVCVVNADSIITADRGIAAAAESRGLQVLIIQPGRIRLDGFSYGFIGGAAFKLSSDRLAFTGRLDGHPDKQAILRFLAERSIEPVYLSREVLFDIGTAIPIQEN